MEPKHKVPYNYLPQQFPLITEAVRKDATITERIMGRIAQVANRGDFTLGREVEEFEEKWAQLVGTRFSIGMSNGTDAIAIALDAAGLEAGEEVITSPVSFIATSGGIIQAGGRPKFKDIQDVSMPNIVFDGEPDEWVVPVAWAGNPTGLETWLTNSSKQVVVDAAQGVNASIKNKPLGHYEFNALAYSLHPLKNINVWGDGGMIATNQRPLDHNSRLLRNHGLVGRDIWQRPGFNSRLSTLQAAVGLEVIETFDFMNDQRQKNAEQLTDAFDDIEGITPPLFNVNDGDVHGYHLYQIVVEGNRDACVAYLHENGIEAKIHYDTPLHLQEAMRPLGHGYGDFPIAERFCAQHITLPIHEYLGESDMNYIIEVLDAWEGLR